MSSRGDGINLRKKPQAANAGSIAIRNCSRAAHENCGSQSYSGLDRTVHSFSPVEIANAVWIKFRQFKTV